MIPVALSELAEVGQEAIVAHEVRSPLSIIDMGVRTLAKLEAQPDADAGARAEVLAMIQRNVALAILLMDRIALAHEVEDGTVSLDKRSLDLGVLVRETIADLGYTVLAQRDVLLICGDAMWCDADSTASRIRAGASWRKTNFPVASTDRCSSRRAPSAATPSSGFPARFASETASDPTGTAPGGIRLHATARKSVVQRRRNVNGC